MLGSEFQNYTKTKTCSLSMKSEDCNDPGVCRGAWACLISFSILIAN